MLVNRKDFGHTDEIYLDSASTAMTPRSVIAAMVDYYQNYRATVHRGVYKNVKKATQHYELARQKVGQLIKAGSSEIVFTRNATEAINLVAQTWGRQNIGKGDKIVLTIMEHHSNILPWQQLCKEVGCKIDYIGLTQDYRLNLDDLYKKSANAKCISLTHVSNVLGTINPITKIIKKLKIENWKLKIVVDGAQAIGHIPVNVNDLGCDFYAFSGHKMYGPTGIGVLWGHQELMQAMPPYQTGGEMNKSVTLLGSVWNEIPWKFEAGTPNIAGAIGLGAAVDYINSIGIDRINQYERELTQNALKSLKASKALKLYGPSDETDRTGIFSFRMGDRDPVKLAEQLDQKNISIRSGNLCAQPLLNNLGIRVLNRASLGIYSTTQDIDQLIATLQDML